MTICMCIDILARSHPHLAQNAGIPTLRVLFTFRVAAVRRLRK
jgi:hypothetical protein